MSVTQGCLCDKTCPRSFVTQTSAATGWTQNRFIKRVTQPLFALNWACVTPRMFAISLAFACVLFIVTGILPSLCCRIQSATSFSTSWCRPFSGPEKAIRLAAELRSLFCCFHHKCAFFSFTPKPHCAWRFEVLSACLPFKKRTCSGTTRWLKRVSRKPKLKTRCSSLRRERSCNV